jgi:excisionase family DNA binding protein
MTPKTYTVKEVADILEYSTNSIYTFLKEKRIKGVRVGKGRFRIPQSELDRLLATEKGMKKATTQAAPAPSGTGQQDVAVVSQGDDVMFETEPSKYAHLFLWGAPLQLPNIFEWFVGVSAILSGVALFLFNTTGPRGNGTGFAVAAPMVRIVLIAAGLGVLLGSMFSKTNNPWRRIFHGILSVMGLINAALLWRGGDVNAALVYGALAVLIGVTMFVHIGGIAATTMYVIIILAVSPLAAILSHTDVSVSPVFEAIPLSFPITVAVFLTGAAVCLACIIIGYRRRNWLYLVGMWSAAAAIFTISFLLALVNYWSRSFFFVTIALVAMVLPVWRRIQYGGSRREKALAHAMFAAVSAVFCGAIIAVGIMQEQTWNYHKEEFANKQVYGSILVDTVFSSVEGVLLAAADNPELAAGIQTKDVEAIGENSKVIYEGNEYIRRVVVLDAQGNGLALYPAGTFDQPNFAFRDYFTVARDTGKPYVSNLFRASADNAGRYVVTVAAPVFEKKTKAFLGVVGASVDLDRLANRLQQVAIEERDEFFVVTDSRGMILIHPNRDRVNQQMWEDDLTRLALKGESGVEQGTVLEGKIGMLAYGPVSSLGWAVSLRAPSSSVFALNWPSYMAIFASIGLSILIGCLFLQFVLRKDRKGPVS